MKNIRLFSLGMMVFLISIACMAVTGKPDTNNSSQNNLNKDTATSVPKPTKSSSLAIPKPGGLITKVTLASDTTGSNYEPVNPTTEFGQDATVHAVVTVKNAPDRTNFVAKWFATDVGSAAEPNHLMDQTDTKQGGSGNLDFTLSPKSRFAVGTYRVEIYVNGKLDQLKEFTIIADSSNNTNNSASENYLESVTLSKGMNSSTNNPVNPSSIFGQNETVHAVAKVKDAPDGTNFTAKWLVTDIGDVAEPDTEIDTYSTTLGGSGTIDFKLVPSKPLPKGKYRVAILVNDQTAWEESFDVK
ncbi:MAG TPA: hypothetical protein VF338_10250 [Leptolinea sp.]